MLNHKSLRQQFGERMTNNMAEYMALICALKWLSHRTENGWSSEWTRLEIFSDSQLVCHQVRGSWKTKLWYLKDLKLEVLRLLEPYKHWEITWKPRKTNVERFGH